MAAQEVYDYLSTVTPDVDVTLSVTPQGEVTEESNQNTVVHTGDDGSEERIVLSSTPVFYFSWSWNVLSESDAGTIVDLYHTSAQGMAKSFKFAHTDGHTYVVRFASELTRRGQAASRQGIPGVRLKVLGRVLDA